MNKITNGLMVGKLGILIACYSKKNKNKREKPAALLGHLGCRPPLIGEKHVGKNTSARD